jgi:hypothetical protein
VEAKLDPSNVKEGNRQKKKKKKKKKLIKTIIKKKINNEKNFIYFNLIGVENLKPNYPL